MFTPRGLEYFYLYLYFFYIDIYLYPSLSRAVSSVAANAKCNSLQCNANCAGCSWVGVFLWIAGISKHQAPEIRKVSRDASCRSCTNPAARLRGHGGKIRSGCRVTEIAPSAWHGDGVCGLGAWENKHLQPECVLEDHGKHHSSCLGPKVWDIRSLSLNNPSLFLAYRGRVYT